MLTILKLVFRWYSMYKKNQTETIPFPYYLRPKLYGRIESILHSMNARPANIRDLSCFYFVFNSIR